MQVHSSAPTRLDLAGGTLDIWPLYLFHDDAQTINAAITIRAACVLSESDDGRWRLRSEDTGAELALENLALPPPPEHRLTLRLLQFFRPGPVRLVTRSGSPLGAGLAGSSALNVAVCAALARYTGAHHAPESLLSLAMNLEAQAIRVPTGAQDYRPAMYGGIAAVEMGPDGIHRTALAVDPAAFSERVVLAYTGHSRDSGINNWEVTKRHIDGDPEVVALFDEIADVAAAMRRALEASAWDAVARQLSREWALRKRLAPGVSTPVVEEVIRRGLEAGARAAKVCGAGGGGCVFFLIDPPTRAAVSQAVTETGATVLDARVDSVGLEVVED